MTYTDRHKKWEIENKKLYQDGSIKRNCNDCNIEYSPKSRKAIYCGKCTTARSKKWKQENPEKVREKATRRYRRNKRLVIDYLKKNPCVMCGESRIATLHFDHIDPSEKSFGIANIGAGSIGRLLKEIEKCRVLCANCHAVHTAEQMGWYKNL